MTSYEHVPCAEAVTMVTDYLEGALSVEQRSVLERHLVVCDPCATYLEQMSETIRLTGTLREEDVPEPIMDVVFEAFRELRGA
jgi:anti-sigma factor RsiW